MKTLTTLLIRVGYSLIALIGIFVIACIGLAGFAMTTDTFRLIDADFLRKSPGAIKAILTAPATLAELQAENGPLHYAERFVPAMNGAPAVRVLIIEPANPALGRPGMLDMHGGGYMYGSPEIASSYLKELVLKFGITVVSVDYRLAPNTRYPGSLHDNYAALKWFHDNAAHMGVDPARIAIMGLSAGGGHAAALGILARDRGEIPVLFQLLLCPMLDDRTGSTVDPGPTVGHLIWTRENNREGWAALLGVEPGGGDVASGSVPMRVKNLAGLPPTFISVGSLDLFAAESISFAQRLVDAGVPTELHVFPGGIHGFEYLVPEAQISQKALKARDDFIAGGFGISHVSR